MSSEFDAFMAIFNRPLEVLRVSVEAMTAMKYNGFSCLGDCLAFYAHDVREQADVPALLRLLMYRDVFPALVAQDYWPLIEHPRWWRVFDIHDPQRFGNKRFVMWQGYERNLYEVPIKDLRLSPAAAKTLKHNWVTTLSSCFTLYPLLLRAGEAKAEFHAALEEVVECLKAIDAWTCFEDPDTDWLK